MERNITITLEKAREWYNSDNEQLYGKKQKVFMARLRQRQYARAVSG